MTNQRIREYVIRAMETGEVSFSRGSLPYSFKSIRRVFSIPNHIPDEQIEKFIGIYAQREKAKEMQAYFDKRPHLIDNIIKVRRESLLFGEFELI